MIGVNLGANRDSAEPIADYVTGLEAVYELADYVTINVSSPNTPGLRELQARRRLDALLAALTLTRERLAGGRRPKPLLLKIAPDLARIDELPIAEVALARAIDGLIIANTTLARPAILTSRHRHQTGGLSGPPLFLRLDRAAGAVLPPDRRPAAAGRGRRHQHRRRRLRQDPRRRLGPPAVHRAGPPRPRRDRAHPRRARHAPAGATASATTATPSASTPAADLRH